MMKSIWLLPLLLLGACTTTGNFTPAPPPPPLSAPAPTETVSPSLLDPGPPPLALHWKRSSAEHRAILLQSYRGAELRLRELAAPLTRGSWAVIMDADETLLDNSEYFQRQAAQGHLGFTTAASWDGFVHEAIAPALPGALQFTQLVDELGGRVVIVTNRAERLCPSTQRNLENAGFEVAAVLCRPQGVEEKNTRFEAVQQGNLPALPPLHVAMWVGDNIQDFPGLTQTEARDAADTTFNEFGHSWWILPNPIYGSWQRNPLPGQTMEAE